MTWMTQENICKKENRLIFARNQIDVYVFHRPIGNQQQLESDAFCCVRPAFCCVYNCESQSDYCPH